MNQRKAYQQQYYRKHKAAYQKKSRIWWEKNCERVSEHRRQSNLVYRHKAKQERFRAYGNMCKCCGETEFRFLTIDHIFNDGYLERGHLPRRVCGAVTYVALRKLGYPKDRYQLLCMNCNFGKRMNKGMCPHKGENNAPS